MKEITVTYTISDEQYERLEALHNDTVSRNPQLQKYYRLSDEFDVLTGFLIRKNLDDILDLEERARASGDNPDRAGCTPQKRRYESH